MLSKMRAVPFQNQGHKGGAPKRIICFDVSGPFPPTVEGFRYSFNAICKNTGKRWRGSGRLKSEAEEFLMKLIVRLDNTAIPNGWVETLTSDHGGDVLSKQFQNWLGFRGIFHLTAPGREPNYNAVIERASAVMEQMGFAFLKHANRPRSWWDLAFDHAVFILDRCPRRSNQSSITPFEAFFGVKPDLSDIRIFGCIAYAHVSPAEHQHLEPRAQRGIYVGNDESRRGFKLVLDGKRKPIVARSVVFYEQTLIDAMYSALQHTSSEVSTIPSNPDNLARREVITRSVSFADQSHQQHSSTDSVSPIAQHKLGRQPEPAKKASLLTPTPMEVREIPTSSAQTKEKRYVGKHARLRRELSLAVRSGVRETVCNVVVIDDDGKSTDREYDVVAAHTDGGNGYIGFIPANINQALECEDKEFWKAAMLDELVNHEEVFGAFGPAIPCPP